jgi:exo-poly-alpha-galacturonosidase
MDMMNANKAPVDLIIAPATLASDSLTLVWDKPVEYKGVTGYLVYQNEKWIAKTNHNKTHFTVKGLTPDTTYDFRVEAENDPIENNQENMIERDLPVHKHDFVSTTILTVTTKSKREVIDVTRPPYNADPLGQKLSTTSVQKAIDDCTEGGTVYIPSGTVILTGALELKGNMTFWVDVKQWNGEEPEYRFDENTVYQVKIVE